MSRSARYGGAHREHARCYRRSSSSRASLTLELLRLFGRLPVEVDPCGRVDSPRFRRSDARGGVCRRVGVAHFQSLQVVDDVVHRRSKSPDRLAAVLIVFVQSVEQVERVRRRRIDQLQDGLEPLRVDRRQAQALCTQYPSH